MQKFQIQIKKPKYIELKTPVLQYIAYGILLWKTVTKTALVS